ncbi:MAG: alpha/beta hydrolase [Bdellovibrionaceae bacterium]|nr:alpha/beta hydrolase [Pseudobdellovibrionaceae bacterium]
MSYQPHFEVRKNTAPMDILFVHGNLASKYWWYPVLDLLENQFKTMGATSGSMYVGELRGCGRSPMPESKEIRVNDIVDDFISYTETNHFQNVLLVGHSAGGLISALLLARRPDLFKGALLVDPVGTKGLVNVPPDIADRYKLMENSREMASQIVSATVYNNNPEAELFKTRIMDDVMNSLKSAGVQLVHALMGQDYSSEVATIQQPLKVFYGVHDWVLEKSNALSYKELVSNCQLEELPNNGHCMNYEDPQRMAKEVVSFYKEHFACDH